MFQPVRYTHGWQRFSLPRKYAWFLSQWRQFNTSGGNAKFELLCPSLSDRDPNSQTGGTDYFYQDVWALRRLAALGPTEHHDIGSRFDGFVGQATAMCRIICWDIRPPGFKLANFEFRSGSILELPAADHSIQSISCLHVAEHIGLGRYGDPLDARGTEKAILALQRVLAPGGQLLYSMPIGQERVEFNAQRIWDPRRVIDVAKELQLIEFSAVGDSREFVENARIEDFVASRYACGLYRFGRK